MEIGAHFNRHNLQKTVDSYSLTAAQIFIGSPKSWKRPDLPPEDVATLSKFSGPLFVHAPYLFNPASANPGVRAGTAKNLQKELDNAALVGAGVVIHAGQAGKDSTMEEAVERWKRTLDKLALTAPLIVENTAGGNTAPGRHLDDFAYFMEELADYNLDYCIDTCHSWAGGFGLVDLHSRLVSRLGKAPAVVHMNGSGDPENCGRDRHTNLIVTDKQTELSLAYAEEVGVPVILETPEQHFLRDVELLHARLL